MVPAIDRRPSRALRERRDGSPTDGFQGINREHGADDPRGANAVAAPATVSGEPAAHRRPLGNREGRRQVTTREPGDLPSRDVTPASGGVPDGNGPAALLGRGACALTSEVSGGAQWADIFFKDATGAGSSVSMAA